MTLSLSIYNALYLSDPPQPREKRDRRTEWVDRRSAVERSAARGVFVRARFASASAWKDSGAQ